MIDLAQDGVQILLDRPGGAGMILSCYVDTSISGGGQRVWPQRLKNEARTIERRLENDPTARARFARDLDIVRHHLEDPAVSHTRGMALFSAAEQGLFRAFSLNVPVPDRMVLDEAPYVVPLLEAIHRQRRYLLVLTDSHHAQIYEAAPGHLRLIQQIEHSIPKRQRSAGERWGKQQATIARHRENLLLHYRKALASAIEQTWPTAPFRGIILLGDAETIAAVGHGLGPDLRGHIVHSGPLSWAKQPPDLNETTRAVVDAALAEHDRSLLAEFERRRREHYLVATGPQEVINALWNGQVEQPGYLILEPDRGAAAWRCSRCGSVFATAHETCTYCQGACERVNLWQEILLFAARHNIVAHVVDSHPALAQHGGVAAVLSRAEPWQPAAPPPESRAAS